jgi:hypothetical protein
MMTNASVEELLEQIQHHLDARQGAHGRSSAASHERGDRFSETIYDTLAEADFLMDSICVQPSLTPPSIPLIGGLLQKFRVQAHELVVFYVNRLAGLQGAFNREIVTALSQLVCDLDRGGRADFGDELAALREEVAALRTEVQRIQQSTPR